MKNILSILSLGFILLCFFCNSCNANKKEKQISSILEKDTIIAYHFNVRGFYENDSGIYFYGLKAETIYLYKENREGHFEFDSYIHLPQQYAAREDIFEIEQLVFINMDSIIIYHKNNLALFSVKQDSLLKIFYHSRDNDWFDFVARDKTFLRWNKKRNTLPIIIFQSDYDKRTWLVDTEMLAEFSFENNSYSIFPIKYPYKPYNNQFFCDYYGVEPLFAFNGDDFVIAFTQTPITYFYNAKNNHKDSLYLQNSMYVPLPEPDTARYREIGNDFLHEVMLEHNFYTGIVYDEYNQVYYRFFNKAMPRKNADGLLNTLEDKEFGLTILDTNLQIIGDVSWPWSEHRVVQYPTSKGLYGYSPPSLERPETIIYKRKLIYEK